MVKCKGIIELIRMCDTCDSDKYVEEVVITNGAYAKTMHLCKECSGVLLNNNMSLYKK